MSATAMPFDNSDNFDDLLRSGSIQAEYAFVPAELRALPIWLTFTLEPKKDGTGRMNKLPHNARTGHKAR